MAQCGTVRHMRVTRMSGTITVSVCQQDTPVAAVSLMRSKGSESTAPQSVRKHCSPLQGFCP